MTQILSECSNKTDAFNTQQMVIENKAFLLQLTNFFVDEKREIFIFMLMNDN